MYEIDGVPLSDPTRRWGLHRETQRRTPITVRAVDVVVPGVDGSLPIYGENIEQAALGLEINVYGTPAEVGDRCNFLRGLLAKTHAPLAVTRRDGLTADAKLASLTDPVMTDAYARISAVLSIPSGAWRGPELEWTAGALTGGHEVVTLAGGTRAVSDALVLVQGPATGLSLVDGATGAELRFTGAVPAGEALLVDVGQWRATMGPAVDWDSLGGEVTRDLVSNGPRSATTLWTLTPTATPEGTTRTSVTASATGTTSESGLQIRARSAHL